MASTERADQLIRRALVEGRVQPFIRSKVRRHIEAPMTQMLLGEPQVKQMAAALVRHGFTHESSMAFNSKVAHHKFKRGHRLITVTRFKEPEGSRVIWSSAGLTGHGQDGRGEHYTTLTTHLRAITPRRVHEENSRFRIEPMKRGWAPPDFEDFRNRAWVSPEGNVHPLRQGTEKEPWRGQTHGDWAVTNRSVHGHQGDLWDVFDKMRDAGWVRKTARDFYDIGPHNEDSIATVHKHFTTHHPELDSVRVMSHSGLYKLHKWLRDPAAEKAQTDALARQLTQESEHSWKDEFGEKSDFADLHQRAWITPWDKVHPLGRDGQETHGGWITRVRNSQNPYTEYDDMTKAGWVRKVNPRRYTGAKHAVKNVIAHLRQHHPEVDRALFTAAAGVPYTEYIVHPKYGSATKRGLSHDNTPMSESAPPTSIQWNDPNWMFDRDHAWISPEGEVHKLDKGDHHAYWAMRRGGDFRPMLDRGWIRKADKAIYQVGDPMHFPRVFQHVDTVHPRVKRISITHPREPGALDTATVFNKRDGGWAPEASR